MKHLAADFEVCEQCSDKPSCIFKMVYSGRILISETKAADPLVQAAIKRLQNSCHENAIILEEVTNDTRHG